MKQLTSNPVNTIDLGTFAPTTRDNWGNVYLKPIGLYSNGDKSFLIKQEFDSKMVCHLSASYFENNNSYRRDITLSGVKDYLESQMGSFDIFVFEDSNELLKWLNE